MLELRPMDKNETAEFLSSGEPETLEYFKANISESFENSTLGLIKDSVTESLNSDIDEKTRENISARTGLPLYDVEITAKTLTQDEWKKSPHFREGMDFKDGWSESRAKHLAESYDERKVRGQTIQIGAESEKTMWGSGLAGQLVGGLPDPINLIPFGGAASKGAKIGEKIIRGGIEGAVGNVVVSGVTRPYYEERGIESDFQDYANDLFIGGLMGGGFSTAGHALSLRKGAKLKERATMGKAADVATESMMSGDELDLNSKVQGMNEAIREMRGIPEVMKSERVEMEVSNLEKLGVSRDEAQASITPMAAHIELISSYTGKTFDEAWDEFGASFQRAEIKDGKISEMPAEAVEVEAWINSELESMADDVRRAEPGKRSAAQFVNPEDGQGYIKTVNTSTKSTFPSWYGEMGIKNKEQLLSAIESKNGPVYDRLRKLAEERLEFGNEKSGPTQEYLQAKSKLGKSYNQAAYHGSKHKFDEFKTDRIGSGEGAQFFGWGLYFSRSKQVADGYRLRNLDHAPWTEVSLMNLEEKASSSGVIDKIKTKVEARKFKKENGVKDRGQLFKVDIPEDNVLFDWDATLKEQSPQVREALSKLVDTEGTQSSAKGSDIYKALSEKLGSDKAASDALKEAGIPGLKYVDEKFNGNKELSNFVIFDDSKVKVEETFYKKGDGKDRGAITFQEDGKAIISLFRDADRSTIVHESGHLFLNNLERLSKMDNIPTGLKNDFDSIKSWMGVGKDGKIQTVHHEKFARGFEQYLREGKAPRAELQGVFDKFANWLKTIYKRSENLKVELSPGAREVYARLLGAEREVNINPSRSPDAPVPKFKTEADVSAAEKIIDDAVLKAKESGASDADLEVLRESLEAIDAETLAIDEAFTLFQSGKSDDAAAVKAAAKASGVSTRTMEEIIEAFNEKLLVDAGEKVDPARAFEAAEQLRIQLAAEAKELKRQAALSLSARNEVAAHTQAILKAGGSPRQAVLSLIEGDSSLRGVEGAGKSVDGHYTALAQSTSARCFNDLQRLDDGIEKLFMDDIQFNQSVMKEMIKPGSSGDELAAKAGQVLKKYGNEVLDRANLAGAKIGKLDEWVPRTHDTDKMIGKRSEWKKFMLENLDPDRSLVGLDDAGKDQVLDDIFVSFITDNHGNKMAIDADSPMMRPPRNIAKGMGRHRALHFKSPEAELAYLRAFGQGDNILESMSRHIESMSRSTALMERLGPNPESTIAATIQKIHDDIKADLKAGKITDAEADKMINDMGGVNDLKSRNSDIGHAVAMALGENDSTQGMFKTFSRTMRAVNSLSKLGSALLSQPTDFVHALNERRIVSSNNEAAAWVELFTDYFKRATPEMKEVLEHTGIFVDAMNVQNFNRFEADNLNGRLNRWNDKMFRITGQNWHVRSSKKAAALSLTRELGSNISKSWNDVHPGLKETLIQYGGFNEQKWELLKKVGPEEIDGKAYYHPGLISKIPDEAFDSMIQRELPGVEGKVSPDRAQEITRARQKLEMDLKTFFVEEGRNAAPEPDAKVRRIMSFGSKQGTKTHEAIKLLSQFKTFAFVNYDRSLKGKRMMRDSKDYGGLVHHAVATMALGYMSTVLKDLAKGITPADPTEGKTWGRAALQSGGLGIFGDFFGAAYSARSEGDVITTFAGPTMSTISRAAILSLKSLHGETYEDGSKYASKWVDLARSVTPFSTVWYTRAAQDYLVWSRLKETLEPGSMRRSEKRLKKEFGQRYIYRP